MGFNASRAFILSELSGSPDLPSEGGLKVKIRGDPLGCENDQVPPTVAPASGGLWA